MASLNDGVIPITIPSSDDGNSNDSANIESKNDGAASPSNTKNASASRRILQKKSKASIGDSTEFSILDTDSKTLSVEQFRDGYDRLQRALKNSMQHEKELMDECTELKKQLFDAHKKLELTNKVRDSYEATIKSLEFERHRQWESEVIAKQRSDAAKELTVKFREQMRVMEAEVRRLNMLVVYAKNEKLRRTNPAIARLDKLGAELALNSKLNPVVHSPFEDWKNNRNIWTSPIPGKQAAIDKLKADLNKTDTLVTSNLTQIRTVDGTTVIKTEEKRRVRTAYSDYKATHPNLHHAHDIALPHHRQHMQSLTSPLKPSQASYMTGLSRGIPPITPMQEAILKTKTKSPSAIDHWK